MAKLGKFLFGLTAACAAGAGVYYLLKKNCETEPEEEFDNDFDDDFELDDDLGDVTERGYVSLTPSSDSQDETEEAVSTEPSTKTGSEEDTEHTEEAE